MVTGVQTCALPISDDSHGFTSNVPISRSSLAACSRTIVSRCFSAGVPKPVVRRIITLVVSTGYILGKPAYGNPWLLATMAATVAVCLRTKVSPLWLIAAGGLVGAFLG